MIRERRVKLTGEVARIAAAVGEVYGLELYGVDVLLGPEGPVVVDVNDFPSFRQVPDAPARVAKAVLKLARDGGAAPPSPANGGRGGPATSLPVPRMPAQATVPATVGEGR
jgi:ribosomal protein S6--L-glutamate ligase